MSSEHAIPTPADDPQPDAGPEDEASAGLGLDAVAARDADAAPDADADGAPDGAPDGADLGGAPSADEPPLRASIEAVLLVVDEPVAEVTLAQVLERPRDEVTACLRELAQEYTDQGRGFELREVAGGWRLYTRAECAEVVERFVRDGQQARLTQAALETLAVVAYRQPVSRARVSAVRGVNCDGVMRTLLTRGLVEEAGADGESGATLYRTTSYFLERMGLRSVSELPDLAPFLPDVATVEAEHPGQFSGPTRRDDLLFETAESPDERETAESPDEREATDGTHHADPTESEDSLDRTEPA